MGSLLPRLLCCLGSVWVALLCASPGATLAGTLKKPIDPKQQTSIAFGQRSHWLQPWRAYLDTPPAARLRDAIGINFNVTPEEAPATAQLLGRSGFTRARVELGWNQIDYHDPTRLRDPARVRRYLGALKANGIRPLILLNANHGIPGPHRPFDATLLQPAQKGDRRILLDPPSAAAVVPHKTGLSGWSPYRVAQMLITSVSPDGWATLARPLPRSLKAGRYGAATLRYAPFGPPKLEDGRPNPMFQETLGGWLQYAGAITREAKAVLGGENFDVEVWNELTFGSDFLYQERWYDPPREQGGGDVTKAILNATVAYLRDPRNGVSRIGIGNGFSSQRPWESGATSPPGLTALSKHPYYGIKRFPGTRMPGGIGPLGALGRPSAFTPTYDAFFPEYILTGIQIEHLIRDVSPITTDVYRYAHGRNTRPAGGGAPPGVWVTETNLDPDGAAQMPDPARRHMQAKAALRYYTSFVNKGVSAVHLFAAKGKEYGLVDMNAPDGGETPRAVARLAQTLRGSRQLARTRPLSLLEVSDRHDRRQFDGDGTANHPPLYDREVLAFFPFQVRRGEYVASVYVMTRNLAKPLAPERFSLTIGGLRTSRVHASATDPLTGATVPVKVRRLGRARIRVNMPVTDSPRMLRLTEDRSTVVSLRAKRVSRRRHQTLVGRVRSQIPGCAGRVVVTLHRHGGSRWRRIRVVSASSARAGRFSVSVRRLRTGRYRAQAFAPRAACGRARSRSVRFRVR